EGGGGVVVVCREGGGVVGGGWGRGGVEGEGGGGKLFLECRRAPSLERGPANAEPGGGRAQRMGCRPRSMNGRRRRTRRGVRCARINSSVAFSTGSPCRDGYSSQNALKAS